MDRWEEYRAGKLKLPEIVQSDSSGVLIATEAGYLGPLAERKGWTAAQYVSSVPVVVEPEPEPDYRTAYETLKTSIAAIDVTATKAEIVADIGKLRTPLVTEKAEVR
jgi:hypothetical protein